MPQGTLQMKNILPLLANYKINDDHSYLNIEAVLSLLHTVQKIKPTINKQQPNKNSK
jgi:hypothetical protein